MIRLKSLLLERINWVIKPAPKSLIKTAEEYGGNAFRLKLTGQDLDKPSFADIKDVLDYDRYFGPNSKYATAEYIYIISDDLRKSTNKNFYDIAIYKLDKLPTPATEFTDSKGFIGQSSMYMQSEFEKVYPTLASKVKSSFNVSNNNNNNNNNNSNNNNNNNDTDIEKQNAEWFEANGEKYFADDYNLTGNYLDYTLIFYKVNKTETADNTYVVLHYFINRTYKFNINTPLYRTPIPNDMLISDYIESSIKWFNTTNNIKLNQYLTKSQIGQTTDVYELYKLLGINIVNTNNANLDNEIEIDRIKISKTDLLNNISKIKTDPVYINQFQLLMNRVIDIEITKNPTLKQHNYYTDFWKPFLDAKSQYGKTFGDRTKGALRILNIARLSSKGIEWRDYTNEQLEEISTDLLNEMFKTLMNESKFTLKSIIKEIFLNEQGGFDFSNIKDNDLKRLKTANIKQIEKPKPKPKPATQTKTDTQTWQDKYKVKTDKPYRRGIDDISKDWNVALSWDTKNKVWYFDTDITVILGPYMLDETMEIHVRDDGTLGVYRDGDLWLKAINSGWIDGGKQLAIKEMESGKSYVYKSNYRSGIAFMDVLYQAIKHAMGHWSSKVQNVGINSANGGYSVISR